jgi:arylsulfatase A-like enzyme/cytochrome c-type biogenesis protein CcmH/NrfG
MAERKGGAPRKKAARPPSTGKTRRATLLPLAGTFAGLIVAILLYLWWSSGIHPFRGNTSSYNVLLITADTTRADRLGCYGFTGIRTPIIDGLADVGILFENAYTPAVMTLPAHASIMSGLLPPEHGVRMNGTVNLRPEVETLAEALRAAGYKTGAMVSAAVLDSMFGLDQGFEHYDDNLPESGPHDVFFAQRPAGAVTDLALAWLNTAREGRWFLWAHYFDPHSPYRPPSPFREQYGSRSYEGEIAYMDSEIGRLLAGVGEMGAADRTIVVFVGDHGEGRGDHGEMSHGVFVYDETSRTPMIVTVPGFVNGPRRVPSVVRTTDIMPTILDLLRLPSRAGLSGTSLWPLMAGRAEELELEAYIESAASPLMYGWSPLAALRSGPWKYIHAPSPELYNLIDDPGERKNLIASESATVSQMRERLRDLLSEVRPVRGEAGVALSPEKEAQLRSLGYTAGAGGEFEDALREDPAAIMAGASFGMVDPKNELDMLRRINRISMAYGSGDFRTAIGLAQELLSEEPGNASVRGLLADSYRGLNMHDEALSEYRTILGQNPRNVNALLNVGWVLIRKGDLRSARSTFEKALSLHPGHTFALSSLADIYFVEGDYKKAMEYYRMVILERPAHWKSTVAMARIFQEQGMTYESKVFFKRAIEVNPADLESRLVLGWMQFAEEEYEDALATLDAAALNHPQLAEPHLFRGDVLFAMGRVDEAEQSYQTGLQRAPRAPQGYHGLGRIALSRGNREEARRLLEQALSIEPGYQAAREELRRLDAGGS